jgi:hypothetical protein
MISTYKLLIGLFITEIVLDLKFVSFIFIFILLHNFLIRRATKNRNKLEAFLNDSQFLSNCCRICIRFKLLVKKIVAEKLVTLIQFRLIPVLLKIYLNNDY